MDFRDIHIFVTVAKTGSVTNTASLLGYVQSNITARIRHLENKLGSALFYRHARGMTLNPNGEIFLQYAEKILHLYKEAENVLQDTETPSGTLKIGAMETTTATRLPPILAQYHQVFPDVEISLTSGPTDYLIEAVLNYDLEGAFVSGPIDHTLLEKTAIIEEELVLVSKAKDNPLKCLSTEQEITLLAFREGCSYRKRLEQYLDQLTIKARKIIELGTLDGILGCVHAGLGISLIPKHVIQQSKYSLSTHKIPDEFGLAPTIFISRKNAFKSPALKQFIQSVQNSYR